MTIFRTEIISVISNLKSVKNLLIHGKYVLFT